MRLELLAFCALAACGGAREGLRGDTAALEADSGTGGGGGPGGADSGGPGGPVDADGDGHASLESGGDDCDDSDPSVHPGAPETWYDGVDQDCDGRSDWDADGDGYELAGAKGDSDGDGYGEGDCDDADAGVNPGAPEYRDGLDNDCDGSVDVVPLDAGSDGADSRASRLGVSALDRSGWALASGDVDGDGLSDALVGVPYADPGGNASGAAYLLLGPVSGSGTLDSAVAVVEGPAEGALLGADLALGDADGDGHADLWLAAPYLDEPMPEQGAVYLFLGPLSGTHAAGEADGCWQGDWAWDAAGFSVSAAGDTDGDGGEDFWVGAIRHDRDGLEELGAAYLVLGPATGTHALDEAAAKVYGEEERDYLGSFVGGVGDVDGDGHEDALLGRYGDGSGDFRLLLGPFSGVLSLEDAEAVIGDASLGTPVEGGAAGPGDVDGDGYGDLLVGMVEEGSEAGQAYLFLGPVSGELGPADAEASWSGAEGDRLGCAVELVGDVDGDGRDELALGAPGHGEGGAAYLFFGPASGALDPADADMLLEGSGEGDELG